MKTWSSLPLYRQTAEILKASRCPAYFAESEYFLNVKLWPEQRRIIQEFYKGHTELVLVAGMRASKTFLLSFFSLYETFLVLTRDYISKYHLAKDSPIFGLQAAAKEDQAIDTVFRQTVARLENSPYFKEIPYDKYSGVIHFPKNFTLRVVSSKSATEVGRTSKFICIDEMSRLEETAGPRGGEEVYRLLSKSTATFKEDGHKFIVGTPKHPQDMLMRLYRRGLDLNHVLALKYATWELNPNLSKEDFAEDFAADALGAWRDFGAQPEASEIVYFRNPDILKYCDRPNVLEMLADGLDVKPESSSYVLAGDPALKQDAFGFALGHKSGNSYIIDGVYRFKPSATREINPLEVKDFVLKVITKFPVRKVVFDTWNYPLLLAEIRKHGVQVIQHTVKKEDYDTLLKKGLYEDTLAMPYYSVLDVELRSLLDLGKRVDHPRHGSKDVADAVVNCLWVLSQEAAKLRVPIIEVI